MDEIFDLYKHEIAFSRSSVFTKEDVLKLFTEFYSNISKFKAEQPQQAISTPNILASDFANFTSKVREKLSYYLESSDLIDYDSAEFEIEYNNQLVLNHVNIDLDSWTQEFDDYMLDNFTEVFGDDSIIAEQ
jgi:hypothetical protein